MYTSSNINPEKTGTDIEQNEITIVSNIYCRAFNELSYVLQHVISSMYITLNYMYSIYYFLYCCQFCFICAEQEMNLANEDDDAKSKHVNEKSQYDEQRPI